MENSSVYCTLLSDANNAAVNALEQLKQGNLDEAWKRLVHVKQLTDEVLRSISESDGGFGRTVSSAPTHHQVSLK